MKIRIVVILLLINTFSFSQTDKKGTIRVEKSNIEGIYMYDPSGEMKTYIKIFSDSTVMMANNSEDLAYMEYWFDQMARNSNLPKGKIEVSRDNIRIELKVAQSKEDNILLIGTFIDSYKMQLHRVGKDYDNKDYIFIKQK